VFHVTRATLRAAIGSLCPYCGRPMALTAEATPSRDHIHPRSKGGTLADPANKLICCRQCNMDKGAKTLARFLSWLRSLDDPRAEHVQTLIPS